MAMAVGNYFASQKLTIQSTSKSVQPMQTGGEKSYRNMTDMNIGGDLWQTIHQRDTRNFTWGEFGKGLGEGYVHSMINISTFGAYGAANMVTGTASFVSDPGGTIDGIVNTAKENPGRFAGVMTYTALESIAAGAAVGPELMAGRSTGQFTKGGAEIVTSNGIKIEGFTEHALNRVIERGVKPSSILNAIKNPLKTGNIVIDDLGRSSQRFIGYTAEVVVNPQTGKIISVNPTSSAKAAKLLKQLGQ